VPPCFFSFGDPSPFSFFCIFPFIFWSSPNLVPPDLSSDVFLLIFFALSSVSLSLSFLYHPTVVFCAPLYFPSHFVAVSFLPLLLPLRFRLLAPLFLCGTGFSPFFSFSCWLFHGVLLVPGLFTFQVSRGHFSKSFSDSPLWPAHIVVFFTPLYTYVYHWISLPLGPASRHDFPFFSFFPQGSELRFILSLPLPLLVRLGPVFFCKTSLISYIPLASSPHALVVPPFLFPQPSNGPRSLEC